MGAEDENNTKEVDEETTLNNYIKTRAFHNGPS
jgi:hypothetical protein